MALSWVVVLVAALTANATAPESSLEAGATSAEVTQVEQVGVTESK